MSSAELAAKLLPCGTVKVSTGWIFVPATAVVGLTAKAPLPLEPLAANADVGKTTVTVAAIAATRVATRRRPFTWTKNADDIFAHAKPSPNWKKTYNPRH